MSRIALGRPPAACVVAVPGILCLIAAMTQSWWRLIDTPEPGYVLFWRMGVGGGASLAVGSLFLRRYRAACLLVAGALALVLPLLLLLHIATADPFSISYAVHQTNQADRLVRSISRVDVSSQVGWLPGREILAQLLLRNDYTLVDALETASFFAKGGWYLCLLGGLILFTAAWIWNGDQARRVIIRSRLMLAAATVSISALYLGPLMVSFHYLMLARAAQADARYEEALGLYRTAVRWDPRLDYDLVYHFELGSLYGSLGRLNEPDYWAFVGDTNVRMGFERRAYDLYARNIHDPRANPALPIRYANALLRMGTLDYRKDRPASAIDKWERALRADPNNLQVQYALASGYTTIGNYREASRRWRNIIRANESVGLFRAKYIVSFTYRKVITARAWSGLGWCYYKLHQPDKALLCQNYAAGIGSAHADGNL